MEKTTVTRLDWLQVGVLFLLSPLFIFPGEKFALIFFIIPLLWLVRRIIHKHFFQRTLLDIPLLVILFQVLVSSLLVAYPPYVFPKAAGLLLGIGMFYAVTGLLRTERMLKAGIFLFLAGGLFFSLFSLVGMYTFKVKHLNFLAAIKEMFPRFDFKLPGAEMGFSPNAVGGILILLVPVFMAMLYLYLWDERKAVKLFLEIGLFIVLVVLLLTQSRGSWMGLTAAFVIFVFLSLRKRKGGLVSVIVGLLVVSFLLVPSVLKVDQVKLTTQQAEGTLLFRVQMWDRALPRIAAHPLTGIGLNHFRYLPEIKYDVSHAHNKFIHMAVELGIPAAAAYLALLILTGYMVVTVWKKSKVKWLRAAVLGLGCGQLAQTIYEITDVIPLGAKVGIFFWLSLALIAAIYNFVTRENHA